MLEVRIPNGLAYLLFLGVHPEYGAAVSVCPAVTTRRPTLTGTLFDDSYVTFYPARAAVAQGLVTVVGHLAIRDMPGALRRPGVRSGHGVQTWIIEDGHAETVKRKLSEGERQLPIAAIWNHELLVHRILEGWRPENEG